jgi:hypothetical protein
MCGAQEFVIIKSSNQSTQAPLTFSLFDVLDRDNEIQLEWDVLNWDHQASQNSTGSVITFEEDGDIYIHHPRGRMFKYPGVQDEKIRKLDDAIEYATKEMTLIKNDVNRLINKVEGMESRFDRKFEGLEQKVEGLESKFDRKFERHQSDHRDPLRPSNDYV